MFPELRTKPVESRSPVLTVHSQVLGGRTPGDSKDAVPERGRRGRPPTGCRTSISSLSQRRLAFFGNPPRIVKLMKKSDFLSGMRATVLGLVFAFQTPPCEGVGLQIRLRKIATKIVRRDS